MKKICKSPTSKRVKSMTYWCESGEGRGLARDAAVGFTGRAGRSLQRRLLLQHAAHLKGPLTPNQVNHILREITI